MNLREQLTLPCICGHPQKDHPLFKVEKGFSMQCTLCECKKYTVTKPDPKSPDKSKSP